MIAARRRSAPSTNGARVTSRAAVAADRLRLVQERVVTGRQAEGEVPRLEGHHRRGGALAGLDALGRNRRDLLEEERRLERGRPGRAAAESHRHGRVEPVGVVYPAPGRLDRDGRLLGDARDRVAQAHIAATSAQTRSAAATAPQNAWVCVTARWCETATSARAPARPPSVELSCAVSAA